MDFYVLHWKVYLGVVLSYGNPYQTIYLGIAFFGVCLYIVKIKERKEDVLIISVNFYVVTPTELQ